MTSLWTTAAGGAASPAGVVDTLWRNGRERDFLTNCEAMGRRAVRGTPARADTLYSGERQTPEETLLLLEKVPEQHKIAPGN
jgi:hypothetical protein